MEKLKVLSLFAGIGGIDLGLERTGGFETVAFCEIEPFAQKVLRKHWPDVPIFDDVRKLNAKILADAERFRRNKNEISGNPGRMDETEGQTRTERRQQTIIPRGCGQNGGGTPSSGNAYTVDVICGGYPCQPFSLAGQRRGAEDDRHLWPEFDRLVDELRPAWVIGENVAGHIGMGLDTVLSDLEGKGYACRTFVIPACAVDAPHRRDRVWIVANAGVGRRSEPGTGQDQLPRRAEIERGSEDVADPNRDDAGAGKFWLPEPSVGRVANGIPQRVDRLKALGNAVVPQIPEMIGHAILHAEASD